MATDVDRTADTARVAREYFEALGRADATAPRHFYAAEGSGEVHGVTGSLTPTGAVAFFEELFAAFPDGHFEVLDVIAEGDRAGVRWRARGTFAGPGGFLGFEPNGARADIEGMDRVVVRDGRLWRLDAYMNGAELARQLGTLPPAGSAAEHRMTQAINLRTRFKKKLAMAPEQVADGVWLVRGGFPAREMNVFLIRDGSGVLVYDAGIKAMTDGVAMACASLGGATRVLLGHGHPDHRGVAPYLGAPVLCHADNRADAEGDGGRHYFDYSKLQPHARVAYPQLLRMWDGGPVEIAGTVAEGEVLAGFEVVLLDGHAPGLVGLWRASDRLALVSDCFYALDPQTGRHGPPRVPLAAFNQDTEAARASLRKLAALKPATAWPGHAEALTGDVRGQLEHAADTT